MVAVYKEATCVTAMTLPFQKMSQVGLEAQVYEYIEIPVCNRIIYHSKAYPLFLTWKQHNGRWKNTIF